MTPEEDAQAIVERIPSELPSGGRFVVAIAGPPAAGKSALADALVAALDGRAGLLGMDGFHFDNAILDERGHRLRKGSPHTFDGVSYANTLRTIRNEPGLEMAVPVYDRALGVSRNCASLIGQAHEIVVTEGNYLLLDEEPWSSLREFFDLTVWIDVPLELIEKRILQRWRGEGVDDDEVQRRCHENDLPNARRVHAGSVDADIVIEQPREN